MSNRNINPEAYLMMQAAFDGDNEKIAQLLVQGVDINAQNQDGATALMIAVAKTQTDTVDFLLNKGANSNLTTNEQTTALYQAVEAQELAMRKKDSGMASAGDAKSITDNGRIITSLLAHGADGALVIAVAERKGKSWIAAAMKKHQNIALASV